MNNVRVKKYAVLSTLLLFMMIGASFLKQNDSYAASSSNNISCHSQGSTVTEKYFLYTDWCGNDSITSVYRCNRNGASFGNCKKIVSGKFKHANVLYNAWGSQYFWILNFGNPAKTGAWCYSLDGKAADKSKCGPIPMNLGPGGGTSNYKLLQGYTRYGDYALKGVSGPNQISIKQNGKEIKTLKVGHDSEELEDVSVDGNTGEIYFTTHSKVNGKRTVKLYKYSGYKLPVINSGQTSSSQSNQQSGGASGNSGSSSGQSSSSSGTQGGSSSNQTNSGNSSSQSGGNSSSNTNAQSGGSAPIGDVIHTIFFGDIPADDRGCSIFRILNLALDIFSGGIGIISVIGIAVLGTIYLTAGGNEQRTAMAKRRLFELVIGLACYALLYILISFLMPNGKFNSEDICPAVSGLIIQLLG